MPQLKYRIDVFKWARMLSNFLNNGMDIRKLFF